MKNTTEPLKVNPIQLIARFLFAFIFIKVLLQVLTSIFDLSYSLSAFQFLQILFIKIESKVYWITFLIQEVIDNITKITGQKPVINKAKIAVSNLNFFM